jgi:thioredoxin 1
MFMKRIALFLSIFMLVSSVIRAQAQTDPSKTITLKEFDKRTGDKTKAVLVYFHAGWCAVCAKMLPIVQRLDSVYGAGLEVLEIDTDRDKEVTERYEVDALPVLMLFGKGQNMWIYVGFLSEKELRAELDCYLLVINEKSKKR